MLCATLACLGSLHVCAQADFTWKYEARALGASDLYGYAMWTVPLAKLSIAGANIPLRAEFSTDPRPSPSPSPLGRGWSINFLSSALVEENQSTLRWHRPDGRIFYFSLERGSTSNRKKNAGDPIVYHSNDSAWKATKLPKKRFITLSHKESGSYLIYENGLLVRFVFNGSGKDAETYTISYNRAQRPVRITDLKAGKVLIEVTYDDPSLAKSLNIGETNNQTSQSIVFEYTPAALNQFDAGPYLSKIGDTALAPLGIVYAASEKNANRITFERPPSGKVTNLVWEASSGFIREDDGATYQVENPSLANGGRPAPDPNAKRQDASKPDATFSDFNWRPEEAKITRTDRKGKSEFRFYDRSKGILTKTDKEGVTTITSYLLTSGAMYGKVRKIEEIQDRDDKKTIQLNAYDELGRQIRQIDRNGKTTIWEYLNDGQLVRKIFDGKIIQEKTYAHGKLVSNKLFEPAGILEYTFSYDNERRTVEFIRNGLLEWRRLYDKNTLVQEKPDGTKTLLTYLRDGKIEKTLIPATPK